MPFPTAPVLLSAVAGDGQVTLTWTASTPDVGRTIIAYGAFTNGSGGGVGLVLTTIITGLTNGVEYEFTVNALDDLYTFSDYSNALSATPAQEVGAPGIDLLDMVLHWWASFIAPATGVLHYHRINGASPLAVGVSGPDGDVTALRGASFIVCEVTGSDTRRSSVIGPNSGSLEITGG